MFYPNPIEDICYDEDHIETVLSEIKANFHDYFNKFIDTESGNTIGDESIKKLASAFGIEAIPKKKKVNAKKAFESIQNAHIQSYEKDRGKYQDILDPEALEEYEDDPSYFKETILRHQCPIIRATLQNKKAKELDKYRKYFGLSESGDLLTVVTNLVEFAHEYNTDTYNDETFETIDEIQKLNFSALQEEDYIVYGVIGGGIKSHFLYKLYPFIFPNRSRDAIWALWYLTAKKNFGCKEDSEFLMIDLEESITQQNYFYPYDLFGYYALKIYQLLKKEAIRHSVNLQDEYRFVLVDAFLSFVAQRHIDEINDLKKKVKDDGYGF